MYPESNFELKHPNVLDKLKSRMLYIESYFNKSLCPSLSTEQKIILDKVKHDGFALLDNYLSESILHIMQDELSTALEDLKFMTPCLAQAKVDPIRHVNLINNNMLGTPQELESLGVTFNLSDARNYQQALKEFNPSTLTVDMLMFSEAYRKVWTDPFLLGIVAHYLGMVPKLVEAYVRRNFPAPYRSMNHYWHRDLNNRFHLIKMFVFLSDCTKETGPHEYIQGSHIDYSRLNNQRYYSDDQIDAVYPLTCAKRILSTVKAGTIILEDTRGLHRANVPETGYRDLGYAVFMPLRPFYHHKNYIFPVSAYRHLSSFQKAFIPKSCIQHMT